MINTIFGIIGLIVTVASGIQIFKETLQKFDRAACRARWLSNQLAGKPGFIKADVGLDKENPGPCVEVTINSDEVREYIPEVFLGYNVRIVSS